MASSFGKSFGRELGKNTAKVISNAVFGDSWSTPYRRVNRDVQQRHEDRMRLKQEAAEREERRLRIAERQQANEAYRARRAELNILNSAVLENVDKLMAIPIPKTVSGLNELLGQLSIQMKSIKEHDDNKEEGRIHNQYNKALRQKFSQCLFELRCINPNDPHIPSYGEVLLEQEIERKEKEFDSKNGDYSGFSYLGTTGIFLTFLFILGARAARMEETDNYTLYEDIVLIIALICSVVLIAVLWYTYSRYKLKNKRKFQEWVESERSKYRVEQTATMYHVGIQETTEATEKAEHVDCEDTSIFFDLDANNRICSALRRIWLKYRHSVPAEYIDRRPIFAADGVDDCILFVGVNPSYSPEDDQRFIESNNKHSLLYGSFYQRDDAPPYFKALESFAGRCGKSYAHMNLLYVRENDRDALMKVNQDFIREQLELTYDTIALLKPKAILFFTDYCKNLIFGKGRWVNPETFNNGHYILNGTDIPVIFCEDITTMSGSSLDNLADVVRNSLNFV
jgi:hypothetical protein